MSPQRFDELVSDALDLIPPDLAAAIDNVVVLVEDRHPDEPDLLGLYEGVALTERDSCTPGSLPDTITIYREALLDICETEDEVVDEVAITVIHEIAHHFGIDDDRLHELGWALTRTMAGRGIRGSVGRGCYERAHGQRLPRLPSRARPLPRHRHPPCAGSVGVHRGRLRHARSRARLRHRLRGRRLHLRSSRDAPVSPSDRC